MTIRRSAPPTVVAKGRAPLTPPASTAMQTPPPLAVSAITVATLSGEGLSPPDIANRLSIDVAIIRQVMATDEFTALMPNVLAEIDIAATRAAKFGAYRALHTTIELLNDPDRSIRLKAASVLTTGSGAPAVAVQNNVNISDETLESFLKK